jgi:16S rRNA processing protein RimM
VSADRNKLVRLGRIAGAHGIKGWVKVLSYTEPRDNIAGFDTWILDGPGGRRRVRVEDSRSGGSRITAKLEGSDDRDSAEALAGTDIYVERGALPACAPDEYYWADLEGLEVIGGDGRTLGRIDHLLATGRHDVLVLEGRPERMIPFVAGDVVRRVDLDNGVVEVAWDESFFED